MAFVGYIAYVHVVAVRGRSIDEFLYSPPEVIYLFDMKSEFGASESHGLVHGCINQQEFTVSSPDLSGKSRLTGC